jgi:spermidine/putrescine-binding protein
MRRTRRLAAALLAVALGLAGCTGGGKDHHAGEVRPAAAVGQGEGSLALLSWNGYTEGGSNDPRVDWLTPFEKRTKCRVDVKYAATPAQMLDLMSKPNLHYDGVAAMPEIAGELIDSNQVVPVNTGLVAGYKNLEPALRSQLTVKGKHYAVPFTWGANLVMYDTRTVRAQPDGLTAIFDPAQARKYSGRIVVRDTPLTLADAALYLKAHNRKLHIKDPFALTPKQLTAAASVITKQRPMVRDYWLNPADAVSAFANGEAAVGQVWPYQLDVLGRSGRPVAGELPREGATGWMDAWMIGARADHPNCMYQWLDWVNSPDVQAQVAQWAGVAPANPEACTRGRLRPQLCTAYHVGDRSFLGKITFARLPAASCTGDKCADYADWRSAWEDARG